MYRYQCNGIFLASEIAFPELQECDNEPQLVVVSGKINTGLTNAVRYGRLQQVANGAYILDVKHAARYLLTRDKLTIEKYPGATDDLLRLYILSGILAIAGHMHNKLVLHACAVKINEGALIIASAASLGKSSLALELHRQGYEIVCDDTAAISFDEKQNPFISIGYRYLKIWADSLKQSGYQPEQFERLRPEIARYKFPLSHLSITTFPVKGIIILTEEQGQNFQLNKMDSKESLKNIFSHTFQLKFIKDLGRTSQHFIQSAQLTAKVPVFGLVRSFTVQPADTAAYIAEQFTGI